MNRKRYQGCIDLRRFSSSKHLDLGTRLDCTFSSQLLLSQYTYTHTHSGVPRTPIGGVGQAIILPSTTEVIPQIPRISLRVFGSYYTLAYLAFALFLIWLLSIPFWSVLLFVVFYVFLFCLFSYLSSRKERKTK